MSAILLRSAAVLGLAAALAAQEGTLDLADGETLYQGGWLWTVGHEYARASALGVRRHEQQSTFAAHYGLRYDFQLSLIAPWRFTEEAGAEADGLGDMALAAKWRCFRHDAPGLALNVALIAGLELPTGAHHERAGGVLLEPELQPGSGTLDPFVGLGITHEPGRWRFNAAGIFKKSTEDDDDVRHGDELFVELAAGNRFWLEPYPGPFMRLDVMLRYRQEDADRAPGMSFSGRELYTLGATLAFRPRPSLDFQLALEVPIHEHVRAGEPEQDFFVSFTAGYRF